MRNTKTIYTAQQNKSLANLLKEAKKEGDKANTASDLLTSITFIERLTASLMFVLSLVSLVLLKKDYDEQNNELGYNEYLLQGHILIVFLLVCSLVVSYLVVFKKY